MKVTPSHVPRGPSCKDADAVTYAAVGEYVAVGEDVMILSMRGGAGEARKMIKLWDDCEILRIWTIYHAHHHRLIAAPRRLLSHRTYHHNHHIDDCNHHDDIPKGTCVPHQFHDPINPIIKDGIQRRRDAMIVIHTVIILSMQFTRYLCDFIE